MDDQTFDPTMPGGSLYEYYKCDPTQLAKALANGVVGDLRSGRD